LLGEKIEFGAKAVGLQLPQEGLVLFSEVEGHRRQVAGYTPERANLLRCCAGVVLRNLDQCLGDADDEGVGLAIGLVVVIAKNLLEALRPDQVGERGNLFPTLSQDGSSQAQMFALLTERGGGKWAFGRLGPLVEEIWLGTKREIGVPVLLEARAELRP